MDEQHERQASKQVLAAHQALLELATQVDQLLDARRGPDWVREALAGADVSTLIDIKGRVGKILDRRVGIAGQEGVGKSTLINAIFGQDVVPMDENQPGTAVPIEVRVSRSYTMAYEIDTRDGTIACADVDEFAKHVLQRHNPNNEAAITSARISLPCPHLPSELCLVDLPGSDGMATGFRRDALASLATADAVVVVVQDRNAGPALDLTHEIVRRGVAIDAVAINIQISKLIDASTLQPLPEIHVRDHISSTKNYVAREFIEALPVLKDNCSFFAFHFPSMHALSSSPDTEHWIEEHADEIFRFADWFIEANGMRGTVSRMQRILEEIETKLAECKQRVLADQAQVDGLMNSDSVVHERLALAIEERKQDIREAWAAESKSGRIKELASQAWREFEPHISEYKLRLQEIHRATKASLPDNWLLQNRQLKNDVARDLNRVAATADTRLESRATACIQKYADAVRDIAQEFAAHEWMIVPIDLGPLPIAAIPTTSLWPAAEFDAEPRSLSEYDSARVVQRLLDELATLELSASTAEGGAAFEAFHDELMSVAEHSGMQLERRLDELRSVAQNRQSPVLAAARQNLSKHRAAQELAEAAAVDVKSGTLKLQDFAEEHLVRSRKAQAQLRESCKTPITGLALAAKQFSHAHIAEPSRTRRGVQLPDLKRLLDAISNWFANGRRH